MNTQHVPTRLRRTHSPLRPAGGLLIFGALFAAACDSSSANLTSPAASRSFSLAPTGPSFALGLPAGFSLGTAANFAALGSAGVTCTAPPASPAITVTGGNVGSPGTAPTLVTGFPLSNPGPLPCSLSGTIQLGATAAFADFNTAYGQLLAITCPTDAAHNLTNPNLNGLNLTPGVYCISGTALLTSQMTLSGGTSTSTWVFKTTSLTPSGGGSVVMSGSGLACNVFWQVGAATFSGTKFLGNVLSGSAITFTGSSLAGRALATSDVTMTGSSIAACASNGNGGGIGDGDQGDGDHGDNDKGDHDKSDKDKKDKDKSDKDKGDKDKGDKDKSGKP